LATGLVRGLRGVAGLALIKLLLMPDVPIKVDRLCRKFCLHIPTR